MAWRDRNGNTSDPNHDATRRGTEPHTGIDVKDYGSATARAEHYTRMAADPDYAKQQREELGRILFPQDED